MNQIVFNLMRSKAARAIAERESVVVNPVQLTALLNEHKVMKEDLKLAVKYIEALLRDNAGTFESCKGEDPKFDAWVKRNNQ